MDDLLSMAIELHGGRRRWTEISRFRAELSITGEIWKHQRKVAYVAAEATWSYLTAPFIFARADFETTELGPWQENRQIWHRIEVICADSVATHSRRQVCYFDGSGFLCRVDFTADVLGDIEFAHYPSDYCEFDGILVPTRRRTHVRNADGTADFSGTAFAMDVQDIVFLAG